MKMNSVDHGMFHLSKIYYVLEYEIKHSNVKLDMSIL